MPAVAEMDVIVTTSLADEIAFRVESAILEGVYPPGSRLRQDELCERFGVSRTPVREALRKLQAKKIVIVTPNKGAAVRVLSRKELEDVYAVRSELEGFACRLAAGRLGRTATRRLDQAQGRLVQLIGVLEDRASDGVDTAPLHVKINKANEDFHETIHRAAGNERLFDLLHDLGAIFPKDYVWRANHSSDEMRALNEDEHVDIREALLAGEPETARQRMTEHILHAGSILLRYLDEQGFWA